MLDVAELSFDAEVTRPGPLRPVKPEAGAGAAMYFPGLPGASWTREGMN